MNIFLIFFALPVATIILAAVLQKILKSPILVAAVAFAIYLIVTFAAFDETFLIAAIVYTILAFLSALVVQMLKNSNNGCNNDNVLGEEDTESNNSCGCGCRNRNRYRMF